LSTGDITAKDSHAQTGENIEEKVGKIKDVSVGKSALFKKYKGEANADNIVSAEGCTQYGWQAAVGEKMRCQDVGEDKDCESRQKSIQNSP
jgi:hypothetical protein